MKDRILTLLFLALCISAFSQDKSETARWQQRVANTEIVRDKWGIPHVYGKTDADAVFGLLYAQCEDDFPRVELNYVEKLGRMAELRGEQEIYNDLYIRMIIDSAEAVADYDKSPAWLKELLVAWADGINYYLHRNPSTKPALLKRFKPWYPLLWTDGSIGAINTGDVGPKDLKEFYEGDKPLSLAEPRWAERETLGSNGFAIAPSRSASGNAMLYINPHTTFYFRPEVQMSSGQGLNAYGAVTWGQFFIYQGFNEHCGWMHTSSNADVADTYAERVLGHDKRMFYVYEGKERPFKERKIPIRFLKDGKLQTMTFTEFRTHHGPVMAKRAGDIWVSVRSYNRAMNSLEQSWLRTKAKGLEDYKKVMALRGNTSNNTVFADRNGNIAYWHGNYMPRRDTAYNWGEAVDGSIKATEWKGLHGVDETVQVINPSNGWIQNCNSTPFTVAGSASPKRSAYPRYMAPDGENFRGVNAVRVLSELDKITLDRLIAAGYDTRLPAFEVLVPALIRTFDRDVPKGNVLYNEIGEAIDVLRAWDFRTSESSVATTLAVEWGQKLNPVIQRVYIEEGQTDQVDAAKAFAANAAQQDLLLPMRSVVMELKERFSTWKMPWGEVNRFQRLTGEVRERYDDSKPSLPVGFTSATWGCLPSYVSRVMPGTKKRYGTNGNSFVCAVEFGPRLKAKSVLAGGVNRKPSSPHFTDQADMYAKGDFKEVLFYREDVMRNMERRYRPGE